MSKMRKKLESVKKEIDKAAVSMKSGLHVFEVKFLEAGKISFKEAIDEMISGWHFHGMKMVDTQKESPYLSMTVAVDGDAVAAIRAVKKKFKKAKIFHVRYVITAEKP